jgi:hypothetical protein
MQFSDVRIATPMFDPNADPLSDPMLAELAAGKFVRAADHPWEIEQPPQWDPFDAIERFLKLITALQEKLGIDGEVQLWPGIRNATFHAELVLPPAILRAEGWAVMRASNFGNLIAVLNDETVVQDAPLAEIREQSIAAGYRFIPSAQLRKRYDGHHRGARLFTTWADRLFGYL